jgi:hypothetical protein
MSALISPASHHPTTVMRQPPPRVHKPDSTPLPVGGAELCNPNTINPLVMSATFWKNFDETCSIFLLL